MSVKINKSFHLLGFHQVQEDPSLPSPQENPEHKDKQENDENHLCHVGLIIKIQDL